VLPGIVFPHVMVHNPPIGFGGQERIGMHKILRMWAKALVIVLALDVAFLTVYLVIWKVLGPS